MKLKLKITPRNPKKTTRTAVKWRQHNGSFVKIADMNEVHIQNVLKCLRGKGKTEIPSIYAGVKKSEWINIFETELKNR